LRGAKRRPGREFDVRKRRDARVPRVQNGGSSPKETAMPFRVRGLAPEPFRRYFPMTDAELAALGARRVIAKEGGYPCRVSLTHAAPGDELVLVNYEHQPGHTPYRSRHAIYVRRDSRTAFDGVDVVPEVLAARLLSVRAFDAADMMIDADVVEGSAAASVFERLLENPEARYLQVHNAKRGCYAARVERF
jgi:hypothetical protein